jgi:hypothetical protein
MKNPHVLLAILSLTSGLTTKLGIKAEDSAVVTEGAFRADYLAKENIRGRVRVKRIK